jgi:hypothetical protein
MKKEDNSIPPMNSYEEIAEFWDTHSLADYWDQTEPAEFEISPDLRSRFLVAVEPGLLTRIRQTAYKRGISTESLVNLLLEQRLHELETA